MNYFIWNNDIWMYLQSMDLRLQLHDNPLFNVPERLHHAGGIRITKRDFKDFLGDCNEFYLFKRKDGTFRARFLVDGNDPVFIEELGHEIYRSSIYNIEGIQMLHGKRLVMPHLFMPLWESLVDMIPSDMILEERERKENRNFRASPR